MIIGNEQKRNELKRLTNGVDAASKVRKIIHAKVHQHASLDHVLHQLTDRERMLLTAELIERIAAIVSSYAYGMEYANCDRIDELDAKIKKLEDDLLDARNALTVMTAIGRDMRASQIGFFKAAPGSRERQELLSRSKAGEKSFDGLLAAPHTPHTLPPQTELFNG
jgi:hypothetical protein